MSTIQAPVAVMMIRPDYFGFNPETAASNAFQKSPGMDSVEHIRERAAMEFNGLVLALTAAGVEVIEFSSRNGVDTPDAVFPNNWISFHPDGTVIIYPMMAPSRRLERRLDLITTLKEKHSFEVSEILDLSHFEGKNQYLEGTGSLVCDYLNKIVYANRSPRTDPQLVDRVAGILGYHAFHFRAVDALGQDIYHTNVMMCIGGAFAVVCFEALSDPDERIRLQESLLEHNHELIDISFDQMNRFAGNMMELKTAQGQSITAMSQSAFDCLTSQQFSTLEKYTLPVCAPINTIEKYGGGSVRCMLAGIYLPRSTYS